MGRPAQIRLKDPTEKLDQIKIQLCHDLKFMWARRNWTQIQAAYYCGSSRARVSNVIRLRIKNLTLNLLLRFLACSDPNFEILICSKI